MLQQDFLSKNNDELDWFRSDTDIFETPSKIDSSWIQEPYLFIQETKLNKLIGEKVSQKVNEILEQRASLVFQKVTKTQAKREIEAFIKQRQQMGIFRVSILDIVLNLKLPSEQAEAVMEDYEKRGKIKAI